MNKEKLQIAKRIMKLKADCLGYSEFASPTVMRFLEHNPEIVQQFVENMYIIYEPTFDTWMCPFCIKYAHQPYVTCSSCEWGEKYGKCSEKNSFYQKVTKKKSLSMQLLETEFYVKIRNIFKQESVI